MTEIDAVIYQNVCIQRNTVHYSSNKLEKSIFGMATVILQYSLSLQG